MQSRKLFSICLSMLLIFTWGCNAANGDAVSSDTGSSENPSSESVSSSDSPSASSNASKTPVTTDSSSSSNSPTSETKSLMFAEDDQTKAIFHIGMTREQVKQALTDNGLRLEPNDYGASDEEVLNNDLGFGIIGGLSTSFDSKTDLLNQLIIWSASDTELSSPYETQKGLKIGDTVETAIKLYGEPLEKSKGGDAVNEDLSISYYYDLPINLDSYYEQCKKIAGPDNSSGSKKRGAHLRIDISQMKGDKFNRVDCIDYYADRYGDYLR
ncbi:hypothetical protein CAFE_15640 [Caprobacter fermentans]|uniref:Lipoprotein n=1 Tax=Caproicibacter fermentans TaxID=2576756 RepID=A0A6N8HYG8_9FIRM|nr:hypothetical protein [Caproicibacter fermentans]MVB10866.1 hypothetical protein [Caproicibacter fermentans]